MRSVTDQLSLATNASAASAAELADILRAAVSGDVVSAMQFGAHVEYEMGDGEEMLPVLEHPLAGAGVGKVSDGWDAALGMDGRDVGVFSM